MQTYAIGRVAPLNNVQMLAGRGRESHPAEQGVICWVVVLDDVGPQGRPTSEQGVIGMVAPPDNAQMVIGRGAIVFRQSRSL